MALNLDLSPSYAKLARAWKHLEALERQVPAELANDGPYVIRFSEVDPQTGWCDVTIGPRRRDIRKPQLGVLVGDVVHNLRCALDYVITALVDASNAKLTTRHQFPIFRTEPGYVERVIKKKDGPLQGITHGATLIRDWQPYKLKPDPRLDPLWIVHRFSNADKHRQPAAMMALPEGAVKIHFNGIPVEREPVFEIPNWTPDKEHVIHRIRFDPPYAYNFRVEGPLKVRVTFLTPKFEAEAAQAVSIGQLRKACAHVAMVLDAFKLL